MTYLEHLQQLHDDLKSQDLLEHAHKIKSKIDTIKELSLTCGLGAREIKSPEDIEVCNSTLIKEIENVSMFNYMKRK